MGETRGLLGPAEVRELAGRLGVRPTKTLGQNFVIDANTVRRIVRAAELDPDDVVIEVGPGLGSLTLALLPEVRRVVAVEIDPVLAAELPATAAAREPELAGRLEVLRADAMKITQIPGPAPTALVANLPYNVAVPVVLNLLAALPSLRKALVMVQAEVADRMVAPPGNKIYGVPSVKLAWYGDARRAGPVGRAVFWPAPNVDSGLVAFARREPPATRASRDQVFAVVDAAFAQRRKTLRAALAGWAGSAAAAEEALRAAGVDPRTRGEALDVASFARIAEYGPSGRGGSPHDPPAAAPGDAADPDESEDDGEGAFADGAGEDPGRGDDPARGGGTHRDGRGGVL
ncbi:16S rRNA (adenine(1518)-N(6)/adenine(1519)-N(6))-dimethyltransferase RsmA [Actinomadura sp. WMMB 499]|uniref:16S rRNA (adenine(1518)-N(6)/adenine(1519)-N(6))- dimethyltransferase RsmA n=1 Tax=Actinomadura sp. WMMB 499 TaxID=1219491 RepID=UPI001246FE46|nr:16S rRNA (adenine(1518)-N(6)/adenine(1519)-N(6))-dimethyltransferase RsmA [Actinomadura sp. WMMB 499]QFG24717.1 16S rRNA (adenine(1518)-N(6)/adenine(1519)-N(6))-dimethyltransferase RsmA [Actinomadura sp. WMMB 499]